MSVPYDLPPLSWCLMVVIPASMGRQLVLVGFRQPVIIRQVSLSVAFSVFAWVERSHTVQAYYAAEYHNARADDLSVVGVDPHFEFLSLRMMLFLVPTFFWSSRCVL